jgi:hypothetical protein
MICGEPFEEKNMITFFGCLPVFWLFQRRRQFNHIKTIKESLSEYGFAVIDL